MKSTGDLGHLERLLPATPLHRRNDAPCASATRMDKLDGSAVWAVSRCVAQLRKRLRLLWGGGGVAEPWGHAARS